jgi:AGZA family xanthine/uracil permease-like MFS transporter
MFDIRARGSTVGREVLGGLTTFASMSYILLVQPVVLRAAGMDADAVFMATCLSSLIACLLMGLGANYPVAMAPGMGENFFFVFALCGVGGAAGAFRLSWQEALALTGAVGVIFLLLARVGLRSRLLAAVPDSLKSGIAAGLGLFITLVGFQWGNLVTHDPATCLRLRELPGNHAAWLTLLGVGVMLLLTAWGIRGAVVLGILVTTAATWAAGKYLGTPGVQWQGLAALPHGIEKTAGEFAGGFGTLGGKLFSANWLDLLVLGVILLFLDMLDTMGTLLGVAGRAGLMRDGKLMRAGRALAADATGTVIGAALGTSTVTSYIESVTGATVGARTGLAAIVAGVCMGAAIFFQPLAETVAGGINIAAAGAEPVLRYPMIAAALIFVGGMMMRTIRDIDWDDMTEALPGFLTAVTMPFAFSISAGIAIGFVSYAFGKIVTGQFRTCPLVVYLLAGLFVLQHILACLWGR